MSLRLIGAALCVGFISESASAQTVDMSGCRPLPGLVAVAESGLPTVTWF